MHIPSEFCGITYWDTTDSVYLPIGQVDIHADVIDVSATVTLTQTFWQWSRTETPTAKYVFPVPAQAAVCGFEMRTQDGRVVTAVVKEKEAAKKEFRQAIQQGQMAGLVEHATDDIFTISLGCLPKSQTLTTKLTYVMDLAEDEFVDQLRLQLPKYVGSRYGPLPTELERTWNSPPHCVKFTVNVYMKEAIKRIWSPSHPTLAVFNEEKRGTASEIYSSTAEYVSSMFLSQDFVLCIKVEGLDAPRCFSERGPAGTVAMQLTIVPDVKLPPIPAQEYIFLVDRSGSMHSGGRMQTAKRGLAMLLRALPTQGTSFNILSFGTVHHALWDSSKKYSEQTLAEATKHVDMMDADFGGTEIRAALEYMFKIRSRDKPTSCFVLTDGEAYDIDATIATVTKAVSQVTSSAPLRVFTLGIGETTSTAMCNGIARAGNGMCLMTATTEGIIAKASKLVKAAKTEFLEDVTIDWGTPSQLLYFVRWRRASQGPVLRQGPRALPLLYSGVRLVVFSIVKHNRFKIPNEVIIQARRASTGEVVKFAVAVKQLDCSASSPQTSFIHTLAARRIIMDLEDRERGVISSSTKEAIVHLGQQYQLASRFTSFIAVEGKNQKKLGAAPLLDRLIESKSSANRIQRHSYTASPAVQFTSFVDSYDGYSGGEEYGVPSHDGYLGGEEYGVSRSARGPLPAACIPEWAASTTTDRREYMVADTPRNRARSFQSPVLVSSSPAVVAPSRYHLPALSFAPVASSTSDPVEQLVRLQSFDGAFGASTEFVAIFGRDAVEAGKKHKLDERVWPTILAIAYLRKHLTHEPELLEGLVEKAMVFITYAHINNLQSLLDVAAGLIP